MQDHDIENVLKSAGAREKPPAAVERAVREGLRAEWRTMVSERRGANRGRIGMALAAGLAVAAVATWLALPRPDDSAEPVGRVAIAAKGLRVDTGFFTGWKPAVSGQSLVAGDRVKSDATGSGALALPGGATARLDRRTRVTLASADKLILERGGLYIDGGPGPAAATELAVKTASGTVRHVGTQYEVRLIGSGVRLRVREGRVEWKSKAGPVAEGRGGEQLTIARDGSVAREATPLYGESWAWIDAATPGIELDGLRLVDFLDWAARELGREVRFDRPETEREAASIILHGSVSGLTAEQALAAVLATTRVSASITDGQIVVTESKAPARAAD